MSFSNQHNLQDRLLVKRVLAGDSLAFGIIIKNTEKLITQIIYKMIGNPEDRKDMVQEIYLKAYHNIGRFRFEAKLSTWVAQIAYNYCLNHLASKKISFLDDVEIKNDRSKEEADKNLLSKERTDIIYTAIEKLPPILKTLITLYHNEDLSYAEIQQITRLPEGTIKSYLFRARKALKNDLLQYYKREEI